jgi:hypothetical protein
LEPIVKHTVLSLPELAKDAFMYSQTASIKEKDLRAKQNVISVTKNISMDVSGDFIKKLAMMCAKLFVIWGWPLTAETFKDGLAQLQGDLKKINLKLKKFKKFKKLIN